MKETIQDIWQKVRYVPPVVNYRLIWGIISGLYKLIKLQSNL